MNPHEEVLSVNPVQDYADNGTKEQIRHEIKGVDSGHGKGAASGLQHQPAHRQALHPVSGGPEERRNPEEPKSAILERTKGRELGKSYQRLYLCCLHTPDFHCSTMPAML